jgi:hypothetical protein
VVSKPTQDQKAKNSPIAALPAASVPPVTSMPYPPPAGS